MVLSIKIMLKKILVIFFLVLFLAGCGCQKKEEITIEFDGPTSGPDLDKLKPPYGPNDPVPTEEPREAPIE